MQAGCTLALRAEVLLCCSADAGQVEEALACAEAAVLTLNEGSSRSSSTHALALLTAAYAHHLQGQMHLQGCELHGESEGATGDAGDIQAAHSHGREACDMLDAACGA